MTTRAPGSIIIRDETKNENLFIAYPATAPKINDVNGYAAPIGFFHEKRDADLFAAAPEGHQLLKDLEGMIFENAPFDRFKVAMRLREYFKKVNGIENA